MRHWLGMLALLGGSAVAAESSDSQMLGAKAVLAALPSTARAGAVPAQVPNDYEGTPPPPLPAQVQAQVRKLSADIDAFRIRAAQDSGAGWVGLFERWYTLEHP